MKTMKLTILLLLALFLVACGGGAETAVEPSASDATTSEEMMDESKDGEEMMDESMDDEEMMEEESMDEEMADAEHEEGMAEMEETMEEAEAMDDDMKDDDMAMGDLPLWKTTELTDVRTGETFTLADFAGKTVFVEPMATWCPNCRQQLGNVAGARAQLADREDVVFVGLSVETTLSGEELASYTDENGFDWIFAVVTPEMLVSLADSFGQTVTNPPSTPHFIIRPDGSTTDLTTGFESPEELLQSIEAASQS
ncbi:MAG: TlpA family protein disulfide reductase [Anaerolineales bacterium]|nr:TlpA family protein disulfide reductase [Anaerolineales bacterium]MCB8941208.1 TlpA family protein disulfide reductase [Ardenticatenaceae bacterium]